MDVIGLSSRLKTSVLEKKSDDDFSDRLNYRFTVSLLIFGSIVITTRQYTSEVIKCWCPAHFTGNYESYVAQICWVQNTYFFEPNEPISKSEVAKEQKQIKYYQWVSFFLLFQAFVFYMPRIFWNTFIERSGLSLSDLITAADRYKSESHHEEKNNYMAYLVKNIDQYVDDKRRHDENRDMWRITKFLQCFIPCGGRFLGNYMVILYLITKIIFILNSMLQIYITSVLLGQSFIDLGFNLVKNLLEGQSWTNANSKYFPKVTLCDFMIREIGNPNKSHQYTVQCVLPVNLFNQQVFTAIWFWFVIVLLWNVFGLFNWAKRSFSVNSHAWIIERVDLFNEQAKLKKIPRRLNNFLTYYLEPDGIFMIRMIANNTSDYVATDLIHHLWCQHHEKYGTLFPDEPHQSKTACEFKHEKKEDLKTVVTTISDQSAQLPKQPNDQNQIRYRYIERLPNNYMNHNNSNNVTVDFRLSENNEYSNLIRNEIDRTL